MKLNIKTVLHEQALSSRGGLIYSLIPSYAWQWEAGPGGLESSSSVGTLTLHSSVSSATQPLFIPVLEVMCLVFLDEEF